MRLTRFMSVLPKQQQEPDMNSFEFEPPQQAAWLMTPEHGKTWTAPILSADRKSEG